MNKVLIKSLIIVSAVIGIGLYIGRSSDQGVSPARTEQNKEDPESDVKHPGETTQNEVSVIKGEDGKEIKVTFVELGSVRCIPCRMMQPVMEEIEKEYAGQVRVIFYDVWTPEGRPYSEEYGIRGIPTQVFLDKDGKEFHRHTGYYPKEEIVKILRTQGVK